MSTNYKRLNFSYFTHKTSSANISLLTAFTLYCMDNDELSIYMYIYTQLHQNTCLVMACTVQCVAKALCKCYFETFAFWAVGLCSPLAQSCHLHIFVEYTYSHTGKLFWLGKGWGVVYLYKTCPASYTFDSKNNMLETKFNNIFVATVIAENLCFSTVEL